ncbi:MAG: hypothetical protein IKW58_01585 [Alphaproteobacteria bacterium]|nr:hypothetical protein [Alphaproteobacteria bacterium]
MVGYQTLPLFEFIDKSQTTLGQNDMIYSTWLYEDNNVFDNYQKRITPIHDVLVLDVIAYTNYFNNKNEFLNFDVYKFINYLPYKDGLGYEQSLYIFVKKDIITQ